MTVQKKTEFVPASYREHVESVTCDLCSKVFKTAYDGGDKIEWLGGHGDVAETAVEIGEGHSWPESHNVEYRVYHVCPECFKTKLEPWLQSQGAKPTPREVDW